MIRRIYVITGIILITLLCGFSRMVMGGNQSNSRHPDRFRVTGDLELLYPGNWLNSRGAVLLVLSDEGDFLTGTSRFNDRAVAQLFKVERPYYLHGAWFWIGERLGDSGSINFKVWQSDGSQNKVVASLQVPCSNISAGNSQDDKFLDMFLVMFDSPVYVDDDYLMGLDLTDAGETKLGLLSTRNGDGMGSRLFWKQGSDGNWFSMLNGEPVRADLDLAIFPLIKRPVEAETIVQTSEALPEPSDCFTVGDGSRSNPFHVATPLQLDCIRRFPGAHYIQVADINLNVNPWNRGEGWNPIGDASNPFTGSINGNGFVIENLFINRPESNFTGLFSESDRAEFSHMTFRAVNLYGNDYVGGLVGLATESTFKRISISGNVVRRGNHTGRLFGYQGRASDRIAAPATERIESHFRVNQNQDKTVYPPDKPEQVVSAPITDRGIDYLAEDISPAKAVAEDDTPEEAVAESLIAGEDIVNQLLVGGIVWMTKNLDVVIGTNWYPQYRYIIDGSWQWVTHTEYGRLYDWETALIACPAPWRLPDDQEWQELIDHFGDNDSAGAVLKSEKKAESGFDNHPKWHQPNTRANNQSGFSALPAGFHNGRGSFNDIGRFGGWWTATEATPAVAWSRTMYHNRTTVGRFNFPKTHGLSVRCVRDAE